mmetsp:Transcript_90622/g.255501  ORF Transcript_90622/g.255501 Transcript_90622/m.255501 type:complete len:201 (+) Transcript_90622:314-916(+)
MLSNTTLGTQSSCTVSPSCTCNSADASRLRTSPPQRADMRKEGSKSPAASASAQGDASAAAAAVLGGAGPLASVEASAALGASTFAERPSSSRLKPLTSSPSRRTSSRPTRRSALSAASAEARAWRLAWTASLKGSESVASAAGASCPVMAELAGAGGVVGGPSGTGSGHPAAPTDAEEAAIAGCPGSGRHSARRDVEGA